ncbi:MAG: hypothetical protein WC523_03815 [Patescibacteria group bacterium]
MALKQQDFEDAFILWLSNAAKMKNEREIFYKNEFGENITIEFPTNSPTYAIVRGESTNFGPKHEVEYRNGFADGKSVYWYDNGQKCSEKYYKNGILHGKAITWYRDGSPSAEFNYKNGKLDGVCIRWERKTYTYKDGEEIKYCI